MRFFFWLRRRRVFVAVVAVVAAVVVALQVFAPLQAAPPVSPTSARSHATTARIPIEQQPFYGELELTAKAWSDVVLDQVVGGSPEATLLNFYAVMAEVGHRSERLGRAGSWRQERLTPAERQEQIDDTELLFRLAVKALDASGFPASVRVDMAEEAAIQLKHVLDYVFTHSAKPIRIPDAAGMKAINDLRTTPTDSWRLPGAAITLTAEEDGDPDNEDYRFSVPTVMAIGEMYREIRDFPVVKQPFATPDFFSDFVYTPGYLVPPDWYLALPKTLRQTFEIPFGDQTLFQIVAVLVSLLVFLVVLVWLVSLLLDTYRENVKKGAGLIDWKRDAIAWRRFLIVLPLVPLTRTVKLFVDDVLNLSGLPFVVSTYFFFIIWYVAAGFFFFYLFEALGRSSAEMVVRLRGGGTTLQLQRITNFVMPLCRAIGTLAAIALGYQLLIELGLPSNTVLAFSAVPGLAIGLGASKLLGNLFAGLSIQTDRPLRVGEFCRVGDNLGYITKIGLRSLELQTLESRVTIPNSVADEATIVNYSRRGMRSDQPPMQVLEMRIQLGEDFSPYQLEEVLYQSRRFLAGVPALNEPLVSIDRRSDDACCALVVVAMVELHGWEAYLRLREQLLVHLEELVERAELSEIALGLAYGTTAQQLKRLPALMQQVVEEDPCLQFQACRLGRIGAFSYDHVLEFRSSHLEHDDFEDSLHELNRRIIKILETHGIEIPFPTQTLMLNPADATHS
ncbi:mechanosensitive ion channel family protein [Synechococcus sp. LA31]|uniref:mechanosensitive ion channel family protein n=1 Tax=Synechococcus sp. LA31 TaxID=2741953 RepID=UPI001BDBC677|nr:mechanosensitive ion channel domain-containing protein [Synechococcus sp. LA31]QVV68606.1 mechanosensitive ion channel family protein [Synechococcus sp. LA31]